MKSTFVFKMLSLFTILSLMFSGAFVGGVQRVSAQGSPLITAHLSENRIETSQWPSDASLQLTIMGGEKPYYASKMPIPYQWDNSIGSANFELGPDFTLAPGQIITVSNGLLTKTLTVMNLYVTSFDFAAKTINGQSSPFTQLGVNIWADGGGYQNVQADENGLWQASYDLSTGPFFPFTHGNVSSLDEDGDINIHLINIGNIFAYPIAGAVELQNCMNYRSYTLTIDDPSNGPGVDYSDTQQSGTVAGGTQVVAVFPLTGFTLDMGDQIVITSGHDVRTLVVAPRGSISFDTANDIISGINLPNHYLASDTRG